MSITNVEKFVAGMVHRLIGQYEIDDFLTIGSRGGMVSDYIQDMVQTAHLAVLSAQKRYPKQCKDAPYLKAVIVNSLLKDEQRGRNRRLNTSNIVDEPEFHTIIAPPNGIGHFEAAMDIETLIEKADLSDSERLVLELKYGFGRGEDIGECSVSKTAQLCGRSEHWVKDRLVAAQIRLEVAAER